jgi:hypothetical protein
MKNIFFLSTFDFKNDVCNLNILHGIIQKLSYDLQIENYQIDLSETVIKKINSFVYEKKEIKKQKNNLLIIPKIDQEINKKIIIEQEKNLGIIMLIVIIIIYIFKKTKKPLPNEIIDDDLDNEFTKEL